LPGSLDEFHIDIERVHMAVGSDAACELDGRVTGAAAEIRYDLPIADIGSPIECLGGGTPLVHRLVARHALGIDAGPVVQE
jgi:hypothetical protein